MHRIYLRWPIPTDVIEGVNDCYARLTGLRPNYGVDDESRWYIEVPDKNWAAALLLALHVHGPN